MDSITINLAPEVYKIHKANGTLDVLKADLVNGAMRVEYPLAGYELAIMRKVIKYPDRADYRAEFNAYNEYAEKCKAAVDTLYAIFESES